MIKEPLYTERLVLKPITVDMAESTYQYAGDTENVKMMVFLPYESPEETKETVLKAVCEWEKEEPAYYEFAICYQGEHIGGMTVYVVDENTTELGWILRKDHWNRGFITEAAKAAIAFSAEKLGKRRIIACCDSENPASYRVMEKLGMQPISRLGGRKNRSSDEERIELTYELMV